MEEQILLAWYKNQFVAVDRTVEIYFAGCDIKCPGCQNYELQSREHAVWITPETLIEKLSDYTGVAKQVHILGGEPLQQHPEAMILFCELLQNAFKDATIILFTGSDDIILGINDKDKIGSPIQKLCKHLDYIKCGSYQSNIEASDMNDLHIKLASSNQKLVKIDDCWK